MKKKRFLSVFLSLAMLLSMLCFQASALETPTVTGFALPAAGDSIADFGSGVSSNVYTTERLNSGVVDGAPASGSYDDVLFCYSNPGTSDATFQAGKTYTFCFYGSDHNDTVLTPGDSVAVSGATGATSGYALVLPNNEYGVVLITFTVPAANPNAPTVTGFVLPAAGDSVEDFGSGVSSNVYSTLGVCIVYNGAPTSGSYDDLEDFGAQVPTYDAAFQAGKTYTLALVGSDYNSAVLTAGTAAAISGVTGADTAYAAALSAPQDASAVALITFTVPNPNAPTVTGFVLPSGEVSVSDYFDSLDMDTNVNTAFSYQIKDAVPASSSYDDLEEVIGSDDLGGDVMLEAGHTYSLILYAVGSTGVVADGQVCPLTLTGADAAYAVGTADNGSYGDVVIVFTVPNPNAPTVTGFALPAAGDSIEGFGSGVSSNVYTELYHCAVFNGAPTSGSFDDQFAYAISSTPTSDATFQAGKTYTLVLAGNDYNDAILTPDTVYSVTGVTGATSANAFVPSGIEMGTVFITFTVPNPDPNAPTVTGFVLPSGEVSVSDYLDSLDMDTNVNTDFSYRIKDAVPAGSSYDDLEDVIRAKSLDNAAMLEAGHTYSLVLISNNGTTGVVADRQVCPLTLTGADAAYAVGTVEEYPGGNEASFGDVVIVFTVPADTSLSQLSLDGAALSPAFDPDTTDYTAAVGCNTGTVNLSCLAADPDTDVTVKIGDTVYTDLTALPLGNAGADTVIQVTVTHGNCSTTYTVTVSRGAYTVTGSTAASDGSLTITCDGDLARLMSIRVNGVSVLDYNQGAGSASNDKASVRSGSTVLTLSKDYCSGLANGDYAVEFLYSDGSASTTFTRSAGTTTPGGTTTGGTTTGSTSPKTGDASLPLLALAMLCTAGGALMLAKKKKAD